MFTYFRDLAPSKSLLSRLFERNCNCRITPGVWMRPSPVFCCAVLKVTFSCNLPLADTLSCNPSSVLTFITEHAPKSSCLECLKRGKNGSNFLKPCSCVTFKLDWLSCSSASFCNPHHIPPTLAHWLQTDTLLIDYQFTFSLSQEDDRYYTAINFVATPEEVCV